MLLGATGLWVVFWRELCLATDYKRLLQIRVRPMGGLRLIGACGGALANAGALFHGVFKLCQFQGNGGILFRFGTVVNPGQCGGL